MRFQRFNDKKRNKRIELSILTRYELTKCGQDTYTVSHWFISYWKNKNGVIVYDYANTLELTGGV